ncbi:hypothetical protein [Kitasatospora phosalacinea]|uniref:hypothetical protein n=1 Tax=Kitasatospora phosalacinea TaxID=2065 RepID=UPI0005273EFD|nr:hypothetical protein [Kitasatospora phosalacinea]
MTETPLAARPTDPAAPVFVDASGRRQRRSRRLGWLLAVPAVGYLALVASSALGGPSFDAPFLPKPAAPAGPSIPVSTEPPAPSAGSAADDRPTSGPARTTAPATRQAQATAAPPVAANTAGRTAAPTTAAPPAAATTPGPAVSHGRPSDAPSNSRKPTKSP